MVVIAACGVLQIAASVGRLDALLLFKSPLTARALGVVLVVAGPVLFFATAERNINDYEGGLDGNFQGSVLHPWDDHRAGPHALVRHRSSTEAWTIPRKSRTGSSP